VAPKCYAADASQLPNAEVDLHKLGGMLRHLTRSQMAILGSLLQSASALFKFDLSFGQAVYINLGTHQYLSSYFKGYVFGVTHIGETEYVLVSSKMCSLGVESDEAFTLLRLLPDSLIRVADFKVIRTKLIAKDAIYPPRRLGVPGWKLPLDEALFHKEGMLPPPEEIAAVDIPTLDTAPVAWLEPNRVADVDVLRGKPSRVKGDAKVVKLKSTTKIIDGMTVKVVSGQNEAPAPNDADDNQDDAGEAVAEVKVKMRLKRKTQ
jgi:hypothetical protein